MSFWKDFSGGKIKLVLLLYYSRGIKLPILTLVVLRPEYVRQAGSIPWLLMSWLPVSPGHQQPWYWLCQIGRCYICNVFSHWLGWFSPDLRQETEKMNPNLMTFNTSHISPWPISTLKKGQLCGALRTLSVWHVIMISIVVALWLPVTTCMGHDVGASLMWFVWRACCMVCQQGHTG